MNRIVAIGIAVAALLVAGGVLWLANAGLTPPVQVVEQTIPDDHIPH